MRKQLGGIDMPGASSRNYAGIDHSKIDVMIRELREGGAIISGNNPWHINTRQYGVMLKAEWNEAASMLVVSITHSGWFVPRQKVWSLLDELIGNVQRLETV
jgi:hypothetical protein